MEELELQTDEIELNEIDLDLEDDEKLDIQEDQKKNPLAG